MILRDVIPGGTDANRAFIAPHVILDKSVTDTEQVILCDAQTSGGLLIAIPDRYSDELVQKMHAKGISAARKIGQIKPGSDGKIKIVP
jgi:selenide,water dikinase